MPNLFNSVVDATNNLSSLLIVIASAIILGLLVSLTYMFTNRRSGFISTNAISFIVLPLILSMVVYIVGDSTARALSILGGFSLVRFRSTPVDPTDLTYTFLALSIGVGCGVGFIAYTVVFTVAALAVLLIIYFTKYAAPRDTVAKLRITIPEDMNFEKLFDDIFVKYTLSYSLHRVKTIEFGALFELRYTVNMKSGASPKAMIDEIRTRNGNLEVIYTAAQFMDKKYDI